MLQTAMRYLVPFWSYVSVKFEKRLFFNSKMTPSYMFVSGLNGSSIWYETLLVSTESLNESNALNCNVRSCVVLNLYLVKSEKKLYFKSKITPSSTFVLPI